MLESSSEEKDLGVLVGNKQTLSALGPRRDPGVLQEEHCHQVKGGEPTLLISPGEAHPECCVQFWTLQFKKDNELLEKVQQSLQRQ